MQQFHGPKYYEQPHAAKFHTDIKAAMCAAVEEDQKCSNLSCHCTPLYRKPLGSLLFSWGDLLWRILFPYYIILYYIMLYLPCLKTLILSVCVRESA